MDCRVVHNEQRANDENGNKAHCEHKAHVVPTLLRTTAHMQEVVQVHQNLNKSQNRQSQNRT